MSEGDSTAKQRVPARWWVIWGFSLLGSLSPLVIHYSKNVSQIIEPLRYPWGLLPAHFLIFRWFGELAHYVTGAVILIGLHAWFDPKQAGRKSIIFGAGLVSVFLFLYSYYLGTIFSEIIVELGTDAEHGEGGKASPATS